MREEMIAANKITIGVGVALQMQLMDIQDTLGHIQFHFTSLNSLNSLIF